MVLKFNEALFASETLADFAAKIQAQDLRLTSLPVSLENDKYWLDWRQLLFRSTTRVTFPVSHYLALSVAFHKGLVYNTLSESLL